MRTRCALTVLLLALFQVAGRAGILPAPQLQPGRYVYTIPAGFDPPYIGASGLDEIQTAAAKCHYPYYVVIVDQWNGSSDQDAADAINGLADDWSRQPQFNSKSSIFLLTYDPKKYRFLAGAKWKAELHFEKEAHEPYTQLFEQYAKGTPRDPKDGIITMMKAVDDYLFDQADPARIKARQVAAEQAAAAQRLQQAQAALDEQVETRQNLLSESNYVPHDVASYQQELASAKGVRSEGNPAQMLAAADSLKATNDVLSKFVDEKRAAATGKAIRVGALMVLCFGALFFLVLFLVKRTLAFSELKESFEQKISPRRKEVQGSAALYLTNYDERDSVVALGGFSGTTKQLYDAVTREVDDIFMAVEAMGSQLDECAKLAATASWFDFGPLIEATAALDAPFNFDTNKVNKADLFGGTTKVIRVVPAEFKTELEGRFARSVDDWNRLKRADEARLVVVQDAFPAAAFDAMLTEATVHGIAERWLANHPLAGDDATDAELYASVAQYAMTDPIEYVAQLDGLHRKEAEVRERLDRLIAAIAVSKTDSLEALPDYGDVVLAPADDPTISYGSAKRCERELAGLLAGGATVEEVEAKAAEVRDSYRACAQKAAEAKQAIAASGESIENAQAADRDSVQARERAVAAVTQASQVHRKMGPAEADVREGNQFRQSGSLALGGAQRLHNERRYVDALEQATAALSAFRSAERSYSHSVATCQQMDKDKAAYEAKLASMSSLHQDAVTKVKKYGGKPAKIGAFKASSADDTSDYTAALRVLEAQQQSWDDEVRRAKRAKEESDAEEERARRRRQESSSYSTSSYSYSDSSSSSSSSGSSWGGGSSDSGSSWGGGDSSSGGSW